MRVNGVRVTDPRSIDRLGGTGLYSFLSGDPCILFW